MITIVQCTVVNSDLKSQTQGTPTLVFFPIERNIIVQTTSFWFWTKRNTVWFKRNLNRGIISIKPFKLQTVDPWQNFPSFPWQIFLYSYASCQKRLKCTLTREYKKKLLPKLAPKLVQKQPKPKCCYETTTTQTSKNNPLPRFTVNTILIMSLMEERYIYVF